jgi:hypothetical protein
MARIRGSYPGGPRREGAGDEAGGEEPRAPRLETVEQIEERRGRASLAFKRQRRSRRVWIGLAVALVLAGGAGFYLGIRNHSTGEELTARRMAPRPAGAFDPSFETNRMLQQLWKMEDNEYGGTPPGSSLR